MINGTLDADKSYNNQSTLVLDWQIMANRTGLTLRNTQGFRLAYDNTILQLMKWDGSDVIADRETGTTFSVIAQAGSAGVYNTALRVSTAKSASGNQGYLNISLGSTYETYTCPQGSFVTLAQVRFALRSGKTVADLTKSSIRCMNISELAATAQSSAVLINTTENEITTYEYLRQEAGIAVGGDKLNAPTVDFLQGNTENENIPAELSNPTTPDLPDNPSKPDTYPVPMKPGTQIDYTEPDVPLSQIELDMQSEYSNPYTDVLSTAWFYDSVRYVTEKGLMNGTGNNAFSPNMPMTRAMFATVLHRLAGKPVISGRETFTDVEAGQWYTEAICWTSENKLIMGYGNNEFGTNDNITREQVITILLRYSEMRGFATGIQANLSNYADEHQISKWALNAMHWAVNTEIISGRTPTALVPQGPITRAEVAQVLLNYDSETYSDT